MNEQRNIDRKTLRANARVQIRGGRPSPLLAGLVFFLVSWVINMVSTRLFGTVMTVDWDFFYATGDIMAATDFNSGASSWLFQLLNLALQIVSMVFSAGLTIYCLHASRGEQCSMGMLLDGFGIFFRLIGLSFMTGLFISLWSLLFVIPGIIAAYSYSMAFYLLLDHPDWSIMRCIRESKALMKGYKGQLFLLHLSFIGWNLLCLVPLMQVYVLPYIELSQAGFYNARIGYVTGTWRMGTPMPPESDEKPPWEY